MERVIIHTDGSGINRKNKENSGHGGVGIVMQYGGKVAKHSIGRFENTTSARMEIFAIIKALEICKPGFPIMIITDNQYCQKTIGLGWYEKWIDYELDKANMDLWERYKKIHDKHRAGGSEIWITWVRGHNGNESNETADKLALKGRINQKTVIQDDRNGIYKI